MNPSLVSIWISPKGTRTAAAATSHPVAPTFLIEPIGIGESRYLLRYPLTAADGMAGQPVRVARATDEPAFRDPDQYDVFVEGDPVNAWSIDRTWFNSTTGLEVFFKVHRQQRVWRLWRRTAAQGTAWEVDDETGRKLLEDGTMSAVVHRIVQAKLGRIVSIVAAVDGDGGDYLVIVES